MERLLCGVESKHSETQDVLTSCQQCPVRLVLVTRDVQRGLDVSGAYHGQHFRSAYFCVRSPPIFEPQSGFRFWPCMNGNKD